MSKSFYAVKWMETCYREIAVPNPRIEKLVDEISAKLSIVVKERMGKKENQNILFSLLGKQFLKDFFPNEKYDEKQLIPPLMDPETRAELTEEMRYWLMQKLQKIVLELGFDKSIENGLDDPKLGPFLQYIQSNFQEKLALRVEELKEMRKNEMKAFADFSADSSIHVLGEALFAVALVDPFKMAQILKTLQQKCFPLPDHLRVYIWTEFLLVRYGSKENNSLEEIAMDLRIHLNRNVMRNIIDLKLENAMQSSAQKQIEETVSDIYFRVVSLNPLNNQPHVRESCNVLNVLHIYSGTFNSLFVYWLCPLQLALHKNDSDEEENAMNLALQLDLFVRHCPLTQTELFRISQQVMDSLYSLDPYLHEHLRDIAGKTIKVTDKDFPVECLHQDKGEATKIGSELTLLSGNEIPTNRIHLFEDPSIFIRKWLITVFASALSPFTLLLVWDLLFLGKWERKRFHDMAVILLGLLKHWFYRVKDFRGLKQVFFEESSKLYISDVCRAWLHWQDGGSFDVVPEMNSNIQ